MHTAEYVLTSLNIFFTVFFSWKNIHLKREFKRAGAEAQELNLRLGPVLIPYILLLG